MSVTSRVGQGSTFTIDIPYQLPATTAVQAGGQEGLQDAAAALQEVSRNVSFAERTTPAPRPLADRSRETA